MSREEDARKPKEFKEVTGKKKKKKKISQERKLSKTVAYKVFLSFKFKSTLPFSGRKKVI